MPPQNNSLPERVGILESSFRTLHADLQNTRTEVAGVRNLVESKGDEMMAKLESKTSPNKSLWMQFVALLVAMVTAGAGLNWLIINARAAKTEADLSSAVTIQSLREDWRREREALILDETKIGSEAIHNDILGQIKGIRSHVNEIQHLVDEHIKLPGHPVEEAKLKSLEGEVQDLKGKK